MKWLCIFLATGAFIAAAQAAAVVLGLLLTIGLIVALFTSPREMFGLVALCLIAGLVQAQPLAFLSVVALMIAAKAIRR